MLWVVDVADNRSKAEIDRDISQRVELVGLPNNYILVANKIDLCRDIDRRLCELSELTDSLWVAVSALRGDRLVQLKERIEQNLHSERAETTGATLALTVRQKQELTAGADNLLQVERLLADVGGLQAELAALELRMALDHLAAISGAVVTEEILGRIFSRFCVGK